MSRSKRTGLALSPRVLGLSSPLVSPWETQWKALNTASWKHHLPLEAPSLPWQQNPDEPPRRAPKVQSGHFGPTRRRDLRGTLRRLSRGLPSRRRDFRRRGVFFPVVGSCRPSRTGPCAPYPPRGPQPPGPATMKKFFQRIKADIKFKSAGPGQKLTESAGCVTGVEA